MPDHSVNIEVDGDASVVDVDALQVLAETVLVGELVAEDRVLTALLTGDAELQRLNRKFRGIDEATDVLSFPDGSTEEFVGGAATLGDIAISVETATRQAVAGHLTVYRAVSHLLVHGMLHLCGYDHEDSPGDAERMRRREEHYLGDLSELHD